MTAVIMAVGIFLPTAHYFKLQALPPLHFVFLPVMVLAQAMKNLYFRRYAWQ